MKPASIHLRLRARMDIGQGRRLDTPAVVTCYRGVWHIITGVRWMKAAPVMVTPQGEEIPFTAFSEAAQEAVLLGIN